MNPGQIGKGDSPAQNPPDLSEENMFVWKWYADNVAGEFPIAAGLVGVALSRLDLPVPSLSVFAKKLGLISAMFDRINREKE